MMQVSKCDTVRTRQLGGEWFVYNRGHETMHAFNGSGGLLWGLIEAGTTVDAMSRRIVEEFCLDLETATFDVVEFVNEMESLGMVMISA